MLLWPLSIIVKIRSFIFNILLLVLCLHLFFLFFLFLSFRQSSLQFNIPVKKNFEAVPIVFLPFMKTIHGSLNKINQISDSFLENVSRPSKKKIIINTHQNDLKNKKENLNKKNLNKVTIKKNDSVIQKIEAKKEILKKSNENKKEEVLLKQEQKYSQNQIDIENEQKNHNKIEEKIVSNNDNNANNEICLGRQDMEYFQLCKQIQQEVSSKWKVPVGVSKDLNCTIRVFVDLNGKINDIKFEKSSNVLIFDLSARKAVNDMQIPKEIWGQEILLSF